ncbi:bifunctional riboflavin kinase/FAD synthetase [Arthrobacter sp. H14]|uniref:bifunctional riboflavin kinase/FAD synthetase n=1 Tax=Arthrobacter sp. H14 TaxID=1312959 RepID=UPI0004791046|nr:bifunctional riboflavin kinase/FAD synthetase [Arthrobacter sp. H14]
MHYWKDLAEVPGGFGPSVVTIGNFDGVHRGHQQVLSQLITAAQEDGCAAVAVTFEPHPAKVHRPESAPEQIMGLEDRLETLEATGLDGVLVMHYTLELAANTPEEFVRKVFVDTLGASKVFVGHDVRFGKGNSGDLETMKQLGEQYGFSVAVINEFGSDVPGPHIDSAVANGSNAVDRRCSSTWVRELLNDGDVQTAEQVLGRPHRVRGEVVHGAARGRALGFPTANLAPAATGFIPADGIYAGWMTDAAGRRWPAAISVGSNPTFEGVSRQVEAHVIDRPEEAPDDFDLYGQMVVVEFVDRLRGMVAYKGPEALVHQMRLDVQQTRDVLKAAG